MQWTKLIPLSIHIDIRRLRWSTNTTDSSDSSQRDRTDFDSPCHCRWRSPTNGSSNSTNRRHWPHFDNSSLNHSCTKHRFDRPWQRRSSLSFLPTDNPRVICSCSTTIRLMEGSNLTNLCHMSRRDTTTIRSVMMSERSFVVHPNTEDLN